MKSSVQFSPNKHLENIGKMFKKLYNDEQLADVTLCCKDGTIKAHKLILATSSPYFHRIFTENNRDHPIIIMHGISYQHLRDLVELIYKGNVDVLPESLNPLYELAGEFQLSGISGVLREENDKSPDNAIFRKTHEQEYSLDLSQTEVASSSTPPLSFFISRVRIESNDEPSEPIVEKRRRGRPRKYPIPLVVEKPLIKRGRGRPRLNPVPPKENEENYEVPKFPVAQDPLQDSPINETYVDSRTESEESSEEQDESDEEMSENARDEDTETFRNEPGIHGRDTRYKGLKRVAVDYKDTEIKNENPPSPLKRPEKENVDQLKKEVHSPDEAIDMTINGDTTEEVNVESEEHFADASHPEEAPKLSAWAKKQRKFKCDLCPSSFKRSSHLTRHQLVHTGERPFACDQCDKAFSRHDKLKHHVRKTHEQDYETDYSMDLYHTMASSPPTPPLPFVISHVRTEANDDESTPPPSKRPRGRPRKYPVVEKPLIKRGRGRPRLNPVRSEGNGENYDITNLPYGDLEYLTMPLQESVIIEPLVEIKTEKEENNEEPAKNNDEKKENTNDDEPEVSSSPAQLKVLENRIAKIGECTISVANH